MDPELKGELKADAGLAWDWIKAHPAVVFVALAILAAFVLGLVL